MKTVLHDQHTTLGAKMAPFAGWEMPIQYEGIIKEHLHTRQVASIFDTCHMGEFMIKGPTAEKDLERLLTQNVATIKEGQCRYGYLLQDDGGVLDDLTCYRLAPDHFILVVNAGTLSADADWIQQHLSPDTTFVDTSPGRAKLDVQGPLSRDELEKILTLALPKLKYFYFTHTEIDGVPCMVSRTGYTGEWGYEFYFEASEAVHLWNLFTSTGVVKPAGLGARDTLRLEVGYPLYGHELTSDLTPVSASRGMFMDVEKEFIGKGAVERDLAEGVSRYMAGLVLESKRAARAGDRVFLGDREIGVVTSGSFAPSLDKAVAMAFIEGDLCGPGQELEVETRGKRLGCTTSVLPFYKEGTARKKPSI